MSRDKDLTQLLTGSGVCWDALATRYECGDIEDRFGVRPERIAVPGTTGDSVDNIPGVRHRPRRQAANATTLCRACSTTSIDPQAQVSWNELRRQEPARPSRAAFLSRRLTGIACDSLEAEVDDLEPLVPDLAAVDRFCDAVGFGRMLREQARRIAGGRPHGR